MDKEVHLHQLMTTMEAVEFMQKEHGTVVVILGHGGYRAGSGGGAADIALYGTNKDTNWNNSNHLYSRIIVAGGGGGCGVAWSEHTTSYKGGAGGGTSGIVGDTPNSTPRTPGTAGNQISAGSTGRKIWHWRFYGY